jgi:hypothetical protein
MVKNRHFLIGWRRSHGNVSCTYRIQKDKSRTTGQCSNYRCKNTIHLLIFSMMCWMIFYENQYGVDFETITYNCPRLYLPTFLYQKRERIKTQYRTSSLPVLLLIQRPCTDISSTKGCQSESIRYPIYRRYTGSLDLKIRINPWVFVIHDLAIIHLPDSSILLRCH